MLRWPGDGSPPLSPAVQLRSGETRSRQREGWGASTGALDLRRSRGLCTNNTSRGGRHPRGWQCVRRHTQLPRRLRFACASGGCACAQSRASMHRTPGAAGSAAVGATVHTHRRRGHRPGRPVHVHARQSLPGRHARQSLPGRHGHGHGHQSRRGHQTGRRRRGRRRGRRRQGCGCPG